MSVILFARNPSCALCSLHETAQSVCIPTRPWKAEQIAGASKALLIIGEAPAVEEDMQDRCFVGQSGRTLDGWLGACHLDGIVDIYLTNIVRCRLPGTSKPTVSQTKACQTHLIQDIARLRSAYQEVHLLVLGGEAAKGLRWGGLTAVLMQDQGAIRTIREILTKPKKTHAAIWESSHPVWATYHPAHTLPRRKPNASFAVADHLRLMCRHLCGQVCHLPDPTVNLNPIPATTPLDLLCADTETYGIIEGMPHQDLFRCFHPAKAHWIDGILRSEDFVQTIHIANRQPTGVIQSGSFLAADPIHVRCFTDWLRRLGEDGWLLFMNAQYDLQMLRASRPELRAILNHHMHVEDLAVWNYLEASERTARGLKPLSYQLGVTKYAEGGKGKFVRYDRPDNPKLLVYGQKDCVATLESRDRLRAMIAERYGSASPKLSDYTREWFSRIIWLATYMGEAGVAMSRPKLRALQQATEAERRWCEKTARCAYDLELAGAGSQKSIQRLIDTAVSEQWANVVESKELVLTAKTGLISTAEPNLRLIAGNLPPSDILNQIILLRRHRETRNLLSTYIQPLIGPWARWERGKLPCKADQGQSLIGLGDIGMAYPSWYIVPAVSSDVDDTESGTKHVRFSCKRPALQTGPLPIRNCIVSRFPGGIILKCDLSQAELRMAALLSGDEVMLREFRFGIDLHAQMAKAISGQQTITPLLRAAGKEANFAMIYRAAAPVLRLSILKRTGKDPGLDFCRRTIKASRQRYAGLWAWQDQLIREVTELGYYADPVLGTGRQFLRSLFLNQTDYESTICNCPVQMAAASLLLDAQMATCFEMADQGMQSLCILNIHDAAWFDCVPEEVEKVEEIFARRLTSSSYLNKLLRSLKQRDLHQSTGSVRFPYEAKKTTR